MGGRRRRVGVGCVAAQYVGPLADGGEMMRSIFVGLVALVAACTPHPSPPIVPDATPDGSCETIQKINAARLIRSPDGSAAVFSCDAGAP